MPAEPVAISFANTRSSAQRDRIATLPQWRAWLDEWPGIRAAGHAVDAGGLLLVRTTRDDVQLLLHATTGRAPAEPGAAVRLLDLIRLGTGLELHWQAGHATLAVPPGTAPATLIARHLAHAALGLLLTGPPLGACQEQHCLKLFVTTRADRRWCDSAACGNRARVRSHHRRRRTDEVGAAPMPPDAAG
ncbi:hypothetical protein Sru01_51100 [Sphaerisporangium rufum]|uniref:Zinc finger CGNR domain-containing protein n=1 Tax=Sphaerisporangium rufum TaxID=1381558 RepID=A0A919V3I8_9ACTN|nr:CGNR zinc finger domain-containing protein [Sphaerisporangium rufum]GII80128.1 hypothetical protein Sru01_51100 [Sphaerisporangium rufum]